MSNATNLDKSQTLLNQVEMGERVTLTAIEVIKAIGEEGIWIALGLDIAIVTGEVSEDNPVLFLQRKAVNLMFEDDQMLELMAKRINVPFTSIKFPNPVAPMAQMLLAYGEALKRTRTDDDGKVIFEALDPISRIVLALAIPGFMKLVIKVIPELIPG